jgi:hypothetical protein
LIRSTAYVLAGIEFTDATNTTLFAGTAIAVTVIFDTGSIFADMIAGTGHEIACCNAFSGNTLLATGAFDPRAEIAFAVSVIVTERSTGAFAVAAFEFAFAFFALATLWAFGIVVWHTVTVVVFAVTDFGFGWWCVTCEPGSVAA